MTGNMKNFILIIITALFIFSPCLLQSQTTVQDTIVYGGDEAFPPYEFLDKKGKPDGFNIDLIKAIAKQMGFQVKIKLGPWYTIAQEIEETNKIQVVSLYFSERRAARLDFASPIEMSYYELYLKKGSRFSELLDMEGRSVAVEKGSVADEYFTENFPGIILLRCSSEIAALDSLSQGDCYGAFASNIINYKLVKTADLSNLRKYHKPFLPRLYSFAVKKGNPKLLNLLNIGLLRTQENGTFHDLREKWIHSKEGSWLSQNSKWLFSIIASLIVLFIVWIIALRYSVNKKTRALEFANSRLRRIATFKPTRIDKISADEQITELLEHIKETFEADACVLRILKEDQLELFGSVGIQDENLMQTFHVSEGFGKKVIDAKKALAFKDASKVSAHRRLQKKYPHLYPFVSYAGAPLIYENHVVGIIGVYSKKKKREFVEVELELFQMVADQLAISFENARLFEQNEKQKEILVKQIVSRKAAESELQKSFQTTNTLYEISRELSLSLDMKILGNKILRSVEKLLKWQRGSIWIMNEKKTKISLITYAMEGLKEENYQKGYKKLSPLIQKPEQGVVGWVALNGKNVRIGNVKGDERYQVADSRVKSELCVPIVFGGDSIGCINIESFEENAFSEEDEKLLTALSNLSSSAMQNAILFEKLNFELKERTKAEKEIEKLNKGLELRVEQRTEELRATNKELESFVYSISHDLRAPLRSITGFAEIISKRHKEKLNEEGREYFGYILEAANNMANLINDLLQFSRLARSPLSKTNVDLGEVLEKVKRNLDHDIQQKKANIIFSGKMPILKGDRSLIGQIFSNLIQNAIQYGRKGINPEVVISATDDGKDTIVKIQDNGQGIPEEHFEKIFDIFQRLHSNEEYPGTGIGLAIVKKAVTALGGSIWLESKVDEGTTFFVKFSKN